MHDPNKTKRKVLLKSLSEYILKQLFFSISVNSEAGKINILFCRYSLRFQRIIFNYYISQLVRAL